MASTPASHTPETGACQGKEAAVWLGVRAVWPGFWMAVAGVSGWGVGGAGLGGWRVALVRRVQGAVAAGRRQPDVIPRSLARLPLYEKLDVLQIDTSERSAEETAGCLAFYGRYGTMPSR